MGRDAEPVDIGCGHTITVRFSPLNHVDLTGDERVAWTTEHPVGLMEDHGCGIAGWIPFANADEPFNASRHGWTVEDWEPATFTLSPSLLCRHCGAHGYIRQGRWVPC